jgi:hypothetical protein
MMAETMAGAKCSKSEYDAFMSLLEEQDAANIAEVSNSMYITRVQVKGSDMNTIGRSRSNRNVLLS